MELNAKNLKTLLWSNLLGIKDGTIQSSQADAMATQAREILRTVRIELNISKQSGQPVSAQVKEFAKDE